MLQKQFLLWQFLFFTLDGWIHAETIYLFVWCPYRPLNLKKVFGEYFAWKFWGTFSGQPCPGLQGMVRWDYVFNISSGPYLFSQVSTLHFALKPHETTLLPLCFWNLFLFYFTFFEVGVFQNAQFYTQFSVNNQLPSFCFYFIFGEMLGGYGRRLEVKMLI